MPLVSPQYGALSSLANPLAGGGGYDFTGAKRKAKKPAAPQVSAAGISPVTPPVPAAQPAATPPVPVVPPAAAPASPLNVGPFFPALTGGNQQALGFTLEDLNQQRSDILTDEGIGQSRLTRDFTQYNLPDLINAQAARGAYYTGATVDKADRLRQVTTDQSGDMKRARDRLLAQILKQERMATGMVPR